VADKPDSQDICFVPNGNYAAVIEKLRPGAADPGEIVDLDGRVVGEHRGVIHYTIGQRKGLGIGGLGEPLYVVRLDADRRRWWWGRNRRCPPGWCRCARSTGWATRPSTAARNGN
jgi:tRNA-specific 2-thiouridylase